MTELLDESLNIDVLFGRAVPESLNNTASTQRAPPSCEHGGGGLMVWAPSSHLVECAFIGLCTNCLSAR